MTIEELFVNLALARIGSHYIWGGKDKLIFTPAGLVPHKFTELNDVTQALSIFDCSGLVTSCLFEASKGKLDFRGSHGARQILDSFPVAGAGEEDGTLRLYPGHVAISIGRGRIVEAAGGDESTTSIQAAINRDAKVRVGRDLRAPGTLLGLRRIPLDKSELRAV